MRRITSMIDVCGATYWPCPNMMGLIPSSLPFLKKGLLDLNWLTVRSARHEYFMSMRPRTYSYGNKMGAMEYRSCPFSITVSSLMHQINNTLDVSMNVCFLNKYDDEHQHLGWHADDFPGMIKEQPIVVVSLGAEREIWLKDKRGFVCRECAGTGSRTGFMTEDGQFTPENLCPAGSGTSKHVCPCCKEGWTKAPPGDKQPHDQRLKLEDGSIFIMPPGYQDTHLHRIPKHDKKCGWRISLTFRSFEDPQ